MPQVEKLAEGFPVPHSYLFILGFVATGWQQTLDLMGGGGGQGPGLPLGGL